MNIAFLCANLEPGADGVGDYARRLAGELIREGHATVILALNDATVSETIFQSQEIEGARVPVMRLPNTISWTERAVLARRWLDDFKPDWISLQFVPFAFHPKGLPKNFAGHLKTIIGGAPLHWMFHELWVLWSFPLSLRHRLLGQAQKILIRKSLKQLKPQAVATQLPIYQNELSKIGVQAEILPLHGNIPPCPGADAEGWFQNKCSSASKSDSIKLGFFGNLLPTLDVARLGIELEKLKPLKKPLLILLAGKTGEATKRHWNFLEEEFKGVAAFCQLGELNEREVSYYFSGLDFGLTSYPPELMLKSGSVAAMREHGLTVISCGRLSNIFHDSSARKNFPMNESWSVKQTAGALLRQLQTAR